MDLGKILAEALRSVGEGFIGEPYDGSPKWVIDGNYELAAAAEAFLAKVREAEQAETVENNPPAALYGNVE